jgi:hypothetical protein
MKLKILAIGILLIMTCSTLITTASIDDSMNITLSGNADVKEVKVAILADEQLGWASGKELYIRILNNYQWTVGDKKYKFVTTEIYDEDILRGELTTKNYDVLLMPGAGVGDGESLVKGFFSPLPRVKKWKENIDNFVKSGGGYSGYCGGTMLATRLYKDPGSFAGRVYDRGSLGFSEVKMYMGEESFGVRNVGAGMYICSNHTPLNLDKPENINKWELQQSGIPLDMQMINKHPIFDDYLKDECSIKWHGGPALIIPDDCQRNITVLAKYPEWEISENSSTRLHEWKYIGGPIDIIKGFFKAREIFKEYGKPLPPGAFATIAYSYDWEKTDKIVELNYSNKAGIVAEIYPNENHGRIVLNGLHPQFPIWFGGHIVEAEDTDKNSLLEGLFKWVDRVPWADTPEDELTYTWWIVRRSVAWAAKVPDNDLPPIYGPSQVCDFEQNMTTSEFKVYGNSEIANGIVSLDLYYRYSNDNVNWNEWVLFDTDNDESNGWSWEFNSPNGTGYYQFYSIRNVEYEGYTETERVPLGADATVYVEVN